MSMAALTSSLTTTSWKTPTTGTNTGGCIAYDTVWVINGSSVYGYDRFGGAQTHRFSRFGTQGSDPRFVQPYEDGLVVACDDGRLYKVDRYTNEQQAIAFTGQLQWMRYHEGSVYLSGERGVQRVPPTADATPGQWGLIADQYGQGSVKGEPAIGAGHLFALISSSGHSSVEALTLEGLRSEWSVRPNASPANASSNGPVLCFATGMGKNTVYVVSTTTGKTRWSIQLQAEVTAPVIADDERCYVACANKYLYIRDVETGTRVRDVQLRGVPTGPMLLDGGILYLTDDRYVYALDVATGTLEALETTGRPFLLGLENDLVYFGAMREVRAVRLAGVVRQFYAESSLMQGFDFSGSGAPSKAADYQTEITLLDPAGGPYASQEVHVWATSATRIENEGTTYRVDRSTPALLTTDAAGRLRVTSPTKEPDPLGILRDTLVTPGLILHATFMEEGLTILVRPDAGVHDRLATIGQSDLQDAKDYDGNPIVKEEYRTDDTVMANTAAMINATAGMVKESVETRNRKRSVSQQYCAPGCDMAVICCVTGADYACPIVCSRNFAFSLRTGSTSFGYLDATQTRDWVTSRSSGVVKRSFLGDLWDEIKKGTAEVVDAVVYTVDAATGAVEALVTAIIDGVEHAIEVVVDTIEKAITLVQGIFNAIVGAIQKVLEALSFLFDWDRIVEVHDEIRAGIETSWRSLVTATGGQPALLDQLKGQIDSQFAALKNLTDGTLQKLKSQLGSSSLDLQRANTTGPNPVSGGAKENWLQSKLQENALSESALTSGDSRERSAGSPRSSGSAISFPTLSLPSDVSRDLASFFDQVTGKVSDDVDRAIARVRGDLDVDAGADLLGAALSVLIDVVQGVLDVAIDFAQAVVDLAIDLMKRLVATMLEFVSAPVEIPFVSDLYRWATGNELSVIDLFSLLAAVPVVLVEKAKSTLRMPTARLAERSASPEEEGTGIAAGVLQGIWGVVSGVLAALTVRQSARGYEKIEGSGLSLLEKVRIGIGVGGLFVVRGALLAGILVARSGTTKTLAALLLWFWPTLVFVSDVAAIVIPGDGETKARVTAVFTAVMGFLTIASLIAVAAIVTIIQSGYAIAFATLVGGALMLRLFTLVKDPRVKYVAIAVASAMILTSGILRAVEAGESA